MRTAGVGRRWCVAATLCSRAPRVAQVWLFTEVAALLPFKHLGAEHLPSERGALCVGPQQAQRSQQTCQAHVLPGLACVPTAAAPLYNRWLFHAQKPRSYTDLSHKVTGMSHHAFQAMAQVC